jgi:hypothetical protein
MHEIGIDICFSAAEVRWDNASIPMQPVDKSTEEFEQELFFSQDPLYPQMLKEFRTKWKVNAALQT